MNAYLLSLNKEANISDQWDFGFLKDFLVDNKFDIQNVTKLPKTERAIVVIPARHHKGLEEKVNKQLKNIKHVVLFLMGDEEADFTVDIIEHPSIYIWVQNPHIGVHDKYNKIGTGYPQHKSSFIPKNPVEKKTDVFFAGQVTHERREDLLKVLRSMQKKSDLVKVIPTNGFTKGEQKEEYYYHMSETKIAPAPSGAVIPDSFRLFEALECMAIVIADQKTPKGEILEYWDWLFGEITPFPKVDNWWALVDITNDVIPNYVKLIHKQTEWWIMWKRNFKYKVLEQLNG